MATSSSFQPGKAIKDWLANLAQSGSLFPEDLQELQSHLEETVNALVKSGLSEEEAFLVACHRIGRPEHVEREFEKVNGRNILLSRQWMFLLIGICGYIVFDAFYKVFDRLLKFMVVRLNGGGYLLLSVKFLLAAFLFILFLKGLRKGGYWLQGFQRHLQRKPVTMATAILIAVGLSLFVPLFLGRYQPLFSAEEQRLYGRLLNQSPVREWNIILSVLPWLLVVVFIFVTIIQNAYTKRITFSRFMNQANYLFFLVAGLIWEMLAVSTRMTYRWFDGNMVPYIAFALVYAAGGFVLGRFIRERAWLKGVCFISTGFFAGDQHRHLVESGFASRAFYHVYLSACGRGCYRLFNGIFIPEIRHCSFGNVARINRHP